MNDQFFQTQINRLSETFGGQHYKRERVELIWRELKTFSNEWLSKLIDNFIGSYRQAPLVPEFREAASIERERIWEIEKKRNAKEAHDFFHAKFSVDDQRWAVQQIVRRITGGMSDHDFDLFLNGLKDASDKADPVFCPECEDRGLLWARLKSDGSNHTFRCKCRAGSSHGRNYPEWSDRFTTEMDLISFSIEVDT